MAELGQILRGIMVAQGETVEALWSGPAQRAITNHALRRPEHTMWLVTELLVERAIATGVLPYPVGQVDDSVREKTTALARRYEENHGVLLAKQFVTFDRFSEWCWEYWRRAHAARLPAARGIDEWMRDMPEAEAAARLSVAAQATRRTVETSGLLLEDVDLNQLEMICAGVVGAVIDALQDPQTWIDEAARKKATRRDEQPVD